jgi:hypothetical protein
MPKNKKSEQAALGKALDRALKKKATFVPDCDPAEYTTNVYARLLVRDCDSKTQDEKKQMSDALIQKGLESAGIICSLNHECPTPMLLRYQFVRIECENRLWEVDLKWTFKCLR